MHLLLPSNDQFIYTDQWLQHTMIFCHADSIGIRGNYGTDWVYFTDMHGNPHYVSLTASVDDVVMPVQSTADVCSFWLYTRRNPKNYQLLSLNNVTNSDFMANKPLILVTHGWLVDGSGPATQLIKDAYLDTHDVNVIVVDWRQIAHISYLSAAYKTADIGRQISDLLIAIAKHYAFDMSRVHLIGHSLGAHVMGSAGFQLKTNGYVAGRLTALDASRPFFEVPHLLEGFSANDAAFVDVIHTNVDFLGITNPRGHADFYPNGGYMQEPCCHSETDVRNNCQHTCSYHYFKESVRGSIFRARKCSDFQSYLSGKCKRNELSYMGEMCTPNSHGTFYLVSKNPINYNALL
ncbi:PREDICTED: pancreatic triacylglycerol lipase-like [Papilio polytes]|uniref:pancreatic triacylglycerol lipase-like n=1 Tax=Papilio polytes TaxID=76194 RepID=UPI000675C755|nr:PREDICTED: pancreatic triacylglycerol lipase-like [Papilio polytes]